MGRWAIINALLGVFVALLIFEITRIWTRTLPPIEVVQRASGSGQAPKTDASKSKRGDKGGNNAKAAEANPQAMVTAVVDRDLFDPSRSKPSEQAAVAAAPVVQPPQNVQINGVRVFGKDREAFVVDSGQSRRVRVGDQIQGYTVKIIKPTELVMASPAGDPVSMTLAVEKGKGAPPPGAKPPGPPPRPGQPPPPPPPGGGSPAAGVTASSPAAGIQPPKPTPPVPGKPGAPGMPGAPNVVPPVPGAPPPVVQPGMPQPAAAPGGNPNMQVPNQVRDSLERFREQQRERREMGHNK